MKVDVIVYRNGKPELKETRMDYEQFTIRGDIWLKGLMTGPEDFIAVRPSKRQGGE